MTGLFRLLVFCLLFTHLFTWTGMATDANEKRKPSFISQMVETVNLDQVTMFDATHELSVNTGVPINFEAADDDQKKLSLHLDDITLSDALDLLVSENLKYTWRENKEAKVITVFPKNVLDDYAYPLNQRIDSFKIENLEDRKILTKIKRNFSVDLYLPSGVKIYVGGRDTYERAKEARKVSLDLRNVSVRDILNHIVAEQGISRWTYTGEPDRKFVQFVQIPFPRKYVASLEQKSEDRLVININDVKFKFVRIPPGEFMMGSVVGSPHEQPVHKVEITQGFWMGQYEVTQEQYVLVADDLKTTYRFRQLDHPVYPVGWSQTQEFIEKLNGIVSAGTFRLPTEAEWEYACRAGTTTRFYTGDDEEDVLRAGWVSENSDKEVHPVGQKEPNNFGLYDMHGNAGEWCSDWFGDYSSEDQVDPQGPNAGEKRVLRGGFAMFRGNGATSSKRFDLRPDRGRLQSGFRLVFEKTER